MKKFEVIWRHLLIAALEGGSSSFSQTGLAEQFHFSTSTIFHALKEPRAIGAVSVTKKACTLTNFEKLLMLWATRRQLRTDILYETRVELPILQIEGLLPGSVIPTAYTSYRFRFSHVPADYDHVYVYASEAEEVQTRFPSRRGRQNLTVFHPDPILAKIREVSLPQLYVDLWNLPEWYSRDFYLAVYHKMEGKLGW